MDQYEHIFFEDSRVKAFIHVFRFGNEDIFKWTWAFKVLVKNIKGDWETKVYRPCNEYWSTIDQAVYNAVITISKSKSDDILKQE